MPGLDPEIAVHRLNIKPDSKSEKSFSGLGLLQEGSSSI